MEDGKKSVMEIMWRDSDQSIRDEEGRLKTSGAGTGRETNRRWRKNRESHGDEEE